MEVNQDIMNLICRLEYRVGEMCSNSNSYNGWTDEWGADFRYPITIDGVGKFKSNICWLEVGPEHLKDMYYKFGSNEMHIGYSLKHVLEELEDLYGLDFVKLEAERKAKLQK